MFTDKLFDHKYDIDQIITALCRPSGRTVLHTRNGSALYELTPSIVKDGDDKGYFHIIEPLPSSFLHEITHNEKFARLNEDEKTNVRALIENAKTCADLPDLFEKGMAGGFVREQIKLAAMEWLDTRNLIPPSMRHVTDISALSSVPENPSRVKIEFDN